MLSQFQKSYEGKFYFFMPRKKKNTEVELPEVLQDESFVDRESSAQAQQSKPKRMSFKTDENGSILWDAMSESQKETFKNTVINDPTVLEAIAGGGAGEEYPATESFLIPSIPEISSDNVRAALDSLMWVEKFVFKKVFKFEQDICERVCKFSEDQHKELDERGARIANKHAPEFLKKYQDEILFLGMLAFYLSLQLQTANNLQEERTKAKRADAEAKARIITPRKDIIAEQPQEQTFVVGAD